MITEAEVREHLKLAQEVTTQTLYCMAPSEMVALAQSWIFLREEFEGAKAEIESLDVLLHGAETRGKMLLEAKNSWVTKFQQAMQQLESQKSELDLARERLGPAGYLILQTFNKYKSALLRIKEGAKFMDPQTTGNNGIAMLSAMQIEEIASLALTTE